MDIRLKLTYSNLMCVIILIWILSFIFITIYYHIIDKEKMNPLTPLITLIGGGVIALIIAHIIPSNLGLIDRRAQWIDGQ
jgi:hypothetical protein